MKSTDAVEISTKTIDVINQLKISLKFHSDIELVFKSFRCIIAILKLHPIIPSSKYTYIMNQKCQGMTILIVALVLHEIYENLYSAHAYIVTSLWTTFISFV